jgi:hypothetical protein
MRKEMLVDQSLGDLQSVDGYMNIALERCKEWSDGKLVRSWGDAFVRGNNGTHTFFQFGFVLLLMWMTVTYISADNA